MKSIKYSIILAATLLLSGCGIFRKYSSDYQAPENLFGNDESIISAERNESLADLSWRELFRDPVLQELIDSALSRNTDLSIIRKSVMQAEAALKSARLGYLPTLSFIPSVTFSQNSSYTLPMNLDWNINGFGSITNRKREAEVMALQSLDMEQTVRSQLIAQMASAYSQLQIAHKQLDIIISTKEIWEKVLDTQRALMENGKAYSPSVSQMEAALLDVQIQRKDVEQSIKSIENAICNMLAQTSRPIEINQDNHFQIPDIIGTGIPLQMLERRPDVRAASRDVEIAYYVTNQAKAAMYPGISLSGILGWATKGTAISDPSELISSAIASLTQPIFAQGRLRSNLKISQLQQEQAKDAFISAVIEAGNEVNEYLADCQTAKEKDILYKQEVQVMDKAYYDTQELMINGKASYIEVLTAQKWLLRSSRC